MKADEPESLENQWFDYAAGGQPSPKRWMDAYLAAFARGTGMSFVTFDRGFTVFADLELIVLGA